MERDLYVVLRCLFLLTVGLSQSEIQSQAFANPISGDQTIATWRQELSRELSTLGAIELESIRQSRPWWIDKDPNKTLAFFPPSSDTERPSFSNKTQAILNRHAESLFAVAKTLAARGNEGEAYRALFEVLMLSPTHPQSLKILGPTLNDLFSEMSTQPKITRMRKAERTYGWPANTWFRIDSEHYTILSNASAQDLREIIIALERLYVVWDQVFYDYWAPQGRLLDAFSDQEPLNHRRTRKHAIVVFASRQDYVDRLNGTAPNIEDSKGYYAVKRRQSLFYLGDPSLQKTWLHEATHQLFQERFAARQSVGDRANFWLVEGIAMYMESLVDKGQYATLGGMFSGRLQYARFNLFTRQFFRPIEELCELGQQEFQNDPRVRQLYSESAGVTHWLMSGGEIKRQKHIMELLKRVYQAKAQPDTLLTLTGWSIDSANRDYIRFARPLKANLRQFPPEGPLEGLCLAYGDIDDASLENLKSVTSLGWLDLSEAPISDRGLKHLGHLKDLSQLFLAGTAVADEGITQLLSLTELQELDLSGTRVTHKAMETLKGLPQLKSLSISNTGVDDLSVMALMSIPSLQTINVSGTQITDLGKQRLRSRIQNVID